MQRSCYRLLCLQVPRSPRPASCPCAQVPHLPRVQVRLLTLTCYTCHVTSIMLHVSRKLSCSVPVALNQLGVARERRGQRVTIVSTIIVSTLSVCLSSILVSTRASVYRDHTVFSHTCITIKRVFATCHEITATTDTSASACHY